MAASFTQRLDDIGRRHPRLMAGATIALAALVTVILLAKTNVTPILYEAF